MQGILNKYARTMGLFVAVFAFAGTASAQVKLTSPTSAELVGANISMAGSGYPAGTIAAASTTITVTPAAGAGSAVSFAPTVVSGSGTNRTLVFKLPAALTANLPYTATVAVAGTAGGTTFTTASPATITIEPAGSLANVSPGAGQTGTAVNVTVTGLYTHFAQATAVVTVGGAGSGVTVSNMAVTPGSTTQLTATFNIAANATIGVYPVTVTDGAEVATLAAGFVVTSAANPGLTVSLINPNSAPQGTNSLSVDVQGVGTHFTQGTTVANFGNGITINSITVNSNTDMTVVLSVAAIAPTGPRTVTVVTGGEFAVANNAFTVTSRGASIVSVAPITPVPQGGNATLTLTGLGTHWVQSGTTVVFGGGISTGNITVNSNTSLTVNISVGPGIAPGTYGITTTTAGEIETYSNAVTVTAATPIISGVAPSSGAQCTNSLNVVVNGTFTSFTTGTLSANFGPQITVNNPVTANSATQATINISISCLAATGGRSVTLTSNGTLFTFGFTVTPSAAAVTSVAPSSGLQQSSVALQVTGTNTHWVQGTTVASLGDPNITINEVTINPSNPLSATVNITIGAQASLGPHGISMTTGGEVASEASAFTVLPFTPSLSLSPSTGMTLATGPHTVNVRFTGDFTHFIAGTTQANIDGNGVTIQNFAVVPGSPTQATAQFVIEQNAPATPAYACNPGGGAWHNVTLTTGTEIVTTSFCVTSTPAVLTSITPNNAPQNTTLSVTITGQYTNFQNATLTTPGSGGTAPTTVNFGLDTSEVPNSLVINSATSLTVTIAIDSIAALGWRQVFVNTQTSTGPEQLTIGFLIDGPGTPSLVSVSPNSGYQGQTLSQPVTITGNLTNFTSTAANPANDTIAILGAGITVSNLTILSPTVATATVSISPTTPVGQRTVEMITDAGAEDVSAPLFSVQPGIAAISFAPDCSNANSAMLVCSGALATVVQGAIVPFAVVGTATHFVQGETVMNFGDIVVSQLTVVDATHLNGQIVVPYTAAPGFRMATAVTDGEVAPTSTFALNVIQITGTTLNITPQTAPQGTMHLQVSMNGQNTSWVNGTTVATFGNNNGLVVNSVTVTSPTQATLDLTVRGTAYTGLYSLTVTTNQGGGIIEQESLANVFTVTQGAAIITNVSPTSGVQGTTENVTITGQNTNWTNGVTTAYFQQGGCSGLPNAGINVATVTVPPNTPTSATLSIAISPTAPTGLQTLCMVTLGELVAYQNSFTVTPGTPTLNGVSPVNAQQGQLVSVTLLGQYTHWQNSSLTTPGSTGTSPTTVTFGEGITLVGNLNVTSTNMATATIQVDPLADIGSRNVVVNTPIGGGDEIVQSGSLFSVIAGPAIISTISPISGNQGTHILLQVNGENTHWAQGLSQVTINGAGFDITINGVQVQSPTTLVMDMNISPTASLGLRTVYVSTGGEDVALQNAFLITGGIPSISSVSPSSGQQGASNLNVQISGIYTLWDSTTQVSFGPNININTWTVGDNHTIVASVNIPNGAPLGLQTVTVQTGGQILTSSFNILSNAPPTPYISYEYPSVALVGQTLSVNFVGQYTNWLPLNPASPTSPYTQITFGAGIVVNNFQVTGSNTAVANITIVPTAALGTNTVTMTTGSEVETTSFTITVGTPTITLLSPGSIIQGQTLNVDVVGQYTTFNNSTVFAFSNPGIMVNSVSLFGPTAARLNISAGITAPTGSVTVSETTGTEVAFNNYLSPFSVTQSQAAITMVSPNTAQQGTAPVINVTGFLTHWTGATVFSLGGIGITNVTINSATSATLTLSIAALAATGEYSISATTGGEVATLNNAFVVTPGTPILLSATGAAVQQGMNFSTGILGQLTTFDGTTTVNLGSGVYVTGVNVTSPTSLTVTGNADPLTYTGSRNITVTTGDISQTLVLFNAFSVSTGTAEISQLSPSSGSQGQAAFNVNITGTNTHFTSGETVASFGQGITINSLTVNGLTSATANITIAANAVAQQNTVTLTTLGESASAVNGFTVMAATPVIDFVSPNSGAQGATQLSVTVAGSFTHFDTTNSGKTTANFGGADITTSVNVTSATSATVTATISPTAALTTRNVQLTTNLGGGMMETASKANAFTVTAGPAAISSAVPTNPTTVHQGDSADSITITGTSTNFASGTSTVVFCTGVTATAIQVQSATSIVATVSVSPTAPTGNCGVTVTTGGEVASGSNLFAVLPGVPAITQLSTASAYPGATSIAVVVTGAFTLFAQNTTTANFGPGVTVNSVTVSGPTSATVNISVSASASPGSNNVTLTTGAQVVTLTGGFTILAPAPGTVSGIVTNPDTTVAAGAMVVLTTAAGGSLSTTTNGTGFYSITGVPQGNFTVLATNPAQGLSGAASGQITSGGQQVTVNIQMHTCDPPPAGLIHWWPGDGNPNDIIGASGGTLQNGATFAAGEVGQGFSFNGAGLVSAPAQADMNLTTVSIEGWIMLNAAPTANQNFVVATKGLTTTSENYGLYVALVGSSVQLEFEYYNGGFHQVYSSGPGITTAAFHHVAVTADGSNVTFYVDGQMASQSAQTSPLVSNTSQFQIGSGLPASQSNFNGVIDELSLYNRPLGAAEVQSIFAAGATGKCKACAAPPSGLVSWWTGDSDTRDLQGTNNASASNAVTFVPAVVHNGFKPGAGGYIDIPASASLANQQFTWTAWAMPQGPGPNNDQFGSAIVGQDVDDNDNSTWVGWRATDNRFVAVLGSASNAVVSQDTFPTGQFYQVAITYDGATFKLFVNGNLEGQLALVTTVPYSAIDWTIGAASPNIRAQGYPRTWNGIIDEVQAYNRALSAAEIQGIHNTGAIGDCRPAGFISWYNGDPVNNFNIGLTNGVFAGSLPEANIYENFIVPAGGWTVSGAFFVNAMAVAPTTQAEWEIRSGMSSGNGGTLIASGFSPATFTPIGLSGEGYTAYKVEVDNLSVSLPAGTYWVSVAPANLPAGGGVGTMYTTGTNAIGYTPGSPIDNFDNFPSYGLNFLFDPTSGGSAHEWSFGVLSRNPYISSATPTNPGSVHQGDPVDLITITGTGTHFTSGVSNVAFCAGITTTAIQVQSVTSLIATVSVSTTAPIGNCGVTVTTGGETATGSNLFAILAGVPAITQLNPASAHQGDTNVNVTVTGAFTVFAQNTTTASFGSGVTVNSVTVSGPTSATVNISVSLSAPLGSNNVTLTTGGQAVTLSSGFTIIAPLPAGVSGYVTNPNGSVAANVSVVLTPASGNAQSTTTDQTGFYSFPNVPIGTFTVLATNAALGYAGSGTGQVSTPGQNVMLSIQMTVCAPPPSGLIHWWPGEGAANDVVGMAVGTLSGGATYAPGEVGQGFSFNGAGLVTIPNTSDMGLTSLTMEGWIYMNSVPSASADFVIATKGIAANAENYGLYITANLQLLFEYWNGSTSVQLTSPMNVIAPGRFYHVAVTTNGSMVSFYVDGQLVGQVTQPSALIPNANPLQIGSAQPAYGNRFNGIVDELSLYDQPLSPAQIQAIFNAGSNGKCGLCIAAPSGLVGWWTGDSDATDIIGGNNGTASGTVVYDQAHAVGKGGFQFNGSSYIQVADSPSLEPAQVTVAAWVQATAPGTVRYILDKGSVGGSGGSYAFYTGGTGGLSFYIYVAGIGFVFSPSAPASLWNGAFHFVVGTFDGSTIRLYVDGSQIGNGNPSSAGICYTCASTNSNLYIGTFAGNTSGFTWPGAVDEVQVFNQALTAAQIQAIYNAGGAGECRPGAGVCLAPPSGATAWWTEDGTTADLLGANNPAGANNVTFVPGKVGLGAQFGTGGYIDIPPSPSLNNQQFTWSAWARPDGPGPNNDQFGNEVFGRENDLQNGYKILWRASDNRFLILYNTSLTIVSSDLFPPGQFYLVNASYDGATFKLYVNGKLEAYVAIAETISFNLQPWNIGSTSLLARSIGYPRTWNGVIDEVQVFNQALSQAQIQAIYTAGQAGECKPVAPAFIKPVAYSMLNGATDGSISLWDKTYSGTGSTTTDNAALSGGLGQLTDGFVGGSPYTNNLGRGAGYEWVGWNTTQPTIVFDFGGPQNFSTVSIHSDSNDPNAVLWSSVIVDFSNDGINFSGAVTYNTTAAQQLNTTPGFISIPAAGVGRYVRLRFTHSPWMLISEVEFQ